MTTTARRTLAVALAVTLGATLAITDIHRHAVALVWPYFIAAYDFMGLPVG